MKKITILLMLMVLPTVFVGQNLLLNGDLENTDPLNGGQATGLMPSGTDNTVAIWSTSQTAATRPGINANATVAHGGTNFINLPNDFQSFRQPFTAEVGKQYVVKFWNQFISGQGQLTDSADGIFISIRSNDGNNGVQFDPNISFYIDPTAYDTGWNEIKFTFTAPQTNLLFSVSKQSRTAANNGGTNLNNSARMDDFSITPYAEWDGSESTDWANVANWSGNVVPDQNYDVVIPSSSTVVISSTTGANILNLSIDPTSTLTINGGGSLVIPANATFSGNITYNRTLQADKWHFVAPPVVGATYNDTWIGNNDIASGTGNNRGISTYQNGAADPTTGQWVYAQAGGSGTFETSKGYSLRRSSTGTVSFTGTYPTGARPATATSPTELGTNKFNLIGNPYPMYLSIANFYSVNPSTKFTEDTIWIWDQSANSGTGGYVQKTALLDPTFQIAPGQAFFISSEDATNVIFYQYLGTNQTDTFLKSERTQVNLKIASNNASTSAELYYLAEGTNDFDNGYDASMFTGVTSNFSLYTAQLSDASKKLARQVLSNENVETLVVPVGIKAAAGQEITFTAEAMNLPEGIKVFLEDRENNAITRLDEANSSYKVTLSEAVDGNGRFFLHTKANGVLGTENVMLENVSIYKTSNATLRIVGLENGTSSNIKLYNVLGKQVLDSNFQSKGAVEIPLPKLATGMYIVQLQNENGRINKKIILE